VNSTADTVQFWGKGMAIAADTPRAFTRNGDGRRRKLETEPTNKRAKRSRGSTAGVLENYRMLSTGLWWFPNKELAEQAEEAEREGRPIVGGTWLCSEFHVEAMVRDGDSGDWGLLLHWRDIDKQDHRSPMPAKALGGSFEEIWRPLLAGGLQMSSSPSDRFKLAAYLSRITVGTRARLVDRAGWHPGRSDPVFVMTDQVFGEALNERIIWRRENPPNDLFCTRGTIDEWQAEIGRRCVGNSRLVLWISVAFAGALLGLTGDESGGFHLRGTTSLGKSKATQIAGSVWGGGGVRGFLRLWRSTSSGLEPIAEAHCDALLCLDELGQVSPWEAGEVVYMLCNGAGKNRARRDGGSRRTPQWRLLFLSSGEISLTEKMAEIGQRSRAGQEVRLVDIKADAGKGMGVLEELHDARSPSTLIDELASVALRCYGTPGRRFVESLIRDLPNALTRIDTLRQAFMDTHLKPGSAEQVQRVCSRFALVAAAGELAREFGITGWPAGEAERGVARCFRDWIETRGGVGDADIHAGIRQLCGFFEKYGRSRFEPIWDRKDCRGKEEEWIDDAQRVRDRAGFRKLSGTGWEYFVLPGAWRELAKGYDPAALAAAMIARCLMRRGSGNKSSITKAIPGYGKVRVYHVLPEILSDESSSQGDFRNVPDVSGVPIA
jgi:putative DNA primase/helicase